VTAYYKSSANIQIGEVTLLTEIVILDDRDLVFDLLIGQNFLDHPSVLVINSAQSLVIVRIHDNVQLSPQVEDKYCVDLVKVSEHVEKQET
jgi:hypothetical protein